MSENDFSKALLRGEHPIDVNELTRRVLRRDRRRMWELGILCVLAWVATVMVPWATIMPMLAKIVQYVHGDNIAPGPAPMTREEQSVFMLQLVKNATIITFVNSIACILLAAVCTVALIVSSRRATLRQVNARLAEISDQLRVLASKSV
jgi:hypothetical protein